MSENEICHVYSSGRPLCGFTDEPPGRWPPGHTWTHYGDPYNVTCKGCRAVAEVLVGIRGENKKSKKEGKDHDDNPQGAD